MEKGTKKGKAVYGSGVDRRVENPGKVDESIWERAKKKAQDEYGAGHYAAVSYIYKKMGGRFHKKR